MKKTSALLFFISLSASLLVQAEAYKCRLPDGRIEFSDTGWAGASTLTVRRDETISAESREQAERDVERMRRYIDQREAAHRAESQANAPQEHSHGKAAAEQKPPPSAAAIETCLQEVDRQALSASQREKSEASCRSTATIPPASEPSYIVLGSGNAISNCIRHVQRSKLSPEESQRRIAQCQGAYYPPAAQPAVQTVKPVKPAEPDHPLCRPGQKDCKR